MRRRCKCGEPLVKKKCDYCGVRNKRTEDVKIRGFDNKALKSKSDGGGVLSLAVGILVEVMFGLLLEMILGIFD